MTLPDHTRSLYLFVIPLLATCVVAGCSQALTDAIPVTPTAVRDQRRAYDGAPPVIPHPPHSTRCITCHNQTELAATPFGVAPANPHLKTPGMSAESRCVQCHVFSATDGDVFRANSFVGLSRPRHGSRAHATAPPTIPHPIFMRESCESCHSSLATRPEIRCTHPERTRCVQCHVPMLQAGK